VSLLLFDLITEGEANHQAKLAARLPIEPNPLESFQPKEIFITGTRGVHALRTAR
jgi:hypothetical protein